MSTGRALRSNEHRGERKREESVPKTASEDLEEKWRIELTERERMRMRSHTHAQISDICLSNVLFFLTRSLNVEKKNGVDLRESIFQTE